LTANIITKVVEINNCNGDTLIAAIYKEKFWEIVSPVTKIEVEFISPNVFRSEIIDEVKLKLLNIPIEMTGEMVLLDKGEIAQKGRLIEFNVRNNKDVKRLEGRFRIKQISTNVAKVGVFIQNLELSSDFLNLIGKGASEFILRSKITGLLRNLEKYCKTSNLKDLL